jgi:flagellar hook-associated protein 1
MSGLSQILEIARRSLMAQTSALDTVSHNISNANTTGYSRQRVDLVATDALRERYGYIGTGVTVQKITRLRDSFLDQQIRLTNSALGDASVREQLLSQVEASFNEPSDAGLNAMMSQFFTSFEDLSTSPESSASRNAVLQNGLLLTQSFQRLHTTLTGLRSDLIQDMDTKITKINQLTEEISNLDIRVTNAEAVGANANDLNDQLDTKIDELSKLMDIKVSRDSNNSVMISVGGTTIASRGGSVALKVNVVGNTAQIVADVSGNRINVSSGELGANLDLYNVEIPSYLTQLDDLASAIITRVNTLHSAGYTLEDPPSTGINFFTGTGAADIDINSAIQADVNMIAASADGSSGDNGVAVAIANVINDNILKGNTISPAQFYAGLVSSLGTSINASQNTNTSQQLIAAQLDNQQSAVSGVSIDEETTNLIKFQRAYQAAARVVSVVDEMFQTIIGMK